jgi:hypothetical protein
LAPRAPPFGAARRLKRLIDRQVFDAVHGRGVVTKLRLEIVSAVQVL